MLASEEKKSLSVRETIWKWNRRRVREKHVCKRLWCSTVYRRVRESVPWRNDRKTRRIRIQRDLSLTMSTDNGKFRLPLCRFQNIESQKFRRFKRVRKLATCSIFDNWWRTLLSFIRRFLFHCSVIPFYAMRKKICNERRSNCYNIEILIT